MFLGRSYVHFGNVTLFGRLGCHVRLRFTHEGSISVSGSYDDSKRQVMVDVIDTGGLVVFCRVGRV